MPHESLALRRALLLLLIVLEALLLQAILTEQPVLLAYDHQFFLPVHVLAVLLIAIVILLAQESLMTIKLDELLF
jgi:hypothetical protein